MAQHDSIANVPSRCCEQWETMMWINRSGRCLHELFLSEPYHINTCVSTWPSVHGWCPTAHGMHGTCTADDHVALVARFRSPHVSRRLAFA